MSIKDIRLRDSILERCLGEALIEYRVGNGQMKNPFNGTTSTFLLLVEEHCNPGTQRLVTRILEQLRSLIAGGNEPDINLSWQWSPANCACLLALARRTPSVWECLSQSETERLDFLMELLAYASAFGTNDCNDYRTTFKMVGNFNKAWNPNYRFTAVVPILAAGQYFGSAEEVDRRLLSFDYTTVTERCLSYGFTNAYENLRRPGRTLLEEGGTAYGRDGTPFGSGCGVRAPYRYRGYSLDEPEMILNSLLTYSYSGGAVVSGFRDSEGKPLAYILTGRTSPYEGEVGMLLELGGADRAGIRSSAEYSLADFNMATVALTLLLALGVYDVERDMPPELRRMLTVGNGDLLFKLKNGYRGFSKGAPEKAMEYSDYASLFSLEELWNDVLSELLSPLE